LLNLPKPGHELLPLLALFAAVLAVACGGSEDGAPGASATPVEGGATAVLAPTGSPLDGPYPRYVDEAAGFVIRLGTPDLAVGRHRVSFVVSDERGVVSLPVVRGATHRFVDGPLGVAGDPVDEVTARFYPFPDGIRGLYVLDEVEFTEVGTWGLSIDVPRPDGSVAHTTFAFDVRDEPVAVAVGEEAPASANRTAADVERLTQLSTGAEPDPAVYDLTIAEALAAGRPFVVVFASPGFCTNALCGPQVEMLTELRERWGDEVNFIHVDLYTNPEEIRTGGLEIAERTPVLKEWGLETDEWTFIVGANGRVAARFEAFAPIEEVEPALRAVVEAS